MKTRKRRGFFYKADTVIFAIGQRSDLDPIRAGREN